VDHRRPNSQGLRQGSSGKGDERNEKYSGHAGPVLQNQLGKRAFQQLKGGKATLRLGSGYEGSRELACQLQKADVCAGNEKRLGEAIVL